MKKTQIRINGKHKKDIERQLKQIENKAASSFNFDALVSNLGLYIKRFDKSLRDNALNGLTVVYSSAKPGVPNKYKNRKQSKESLLITCRYENKAWYFISAVLGNPRQDIITCKEMSPMMIESIMAANFNYQYHCQYQVA